MKKVNYKLLFEHYLEDLKPNLNQQLVRCIFHSEKNASLSINTEKGLFKCFACGVDGNHWEFLKLVEPEANTKKTMEAFYE